MRLRSLLFVPGDRPDQMPKAERSGADALILDLEDAVASHRKEQARADVAAFLQREPRVAPLFVRVNPLHSGLTERDLAAIATGLPDGVVLPKAEGAGSLAELARLLRDHGLERAKILPLITETAAAIFRMGEYANLSAGLAGLSWGAEDLAAAVGAETARQADGSYTAPYELVRTLTLFAAHAAQVPAIDTVFPTYRDLDGLRCYADRGARDGFNGMMAIHPAQVAVINAAFTPSAAAVAHARRIVAEFRLNPDAGVVSIDGSMVDAPHLKQAQRLLAQTDAPDDAAGAPQRGGGRSESSSGSAPPRREM